MFSLLEAGTGEALSVDPDDLDDDTLGVALVAPYRARVDLVGGDEPEQRGRRVGVHQSRERQGPTSQPAGGPSPATPARTVPLG